MDVITSRQNRTVKLARALRQRRAREAEGLFLAEGIRLSVQAADARAPVETVICCPELLRSAVARVAIDRLEATGANHVEVSSEVFAGISGRENPQGIAIIARAVRRPIASLFPTPKSVMVALLRPQDPGNVGSILRTCDAVGAEGLIVIGNAVDPFDPRCVRASTGAIFTQAIAFTELEEFHSWALANQVNAVAVTGSAKSDYRTFTYRTPLTLVLGSEREGLDEDNEFPQKVSIPMCGQVDSLNLAVAAGLVLYQACGPLKGETERGMITES